jgi:hypothetical protein
MRCCSSSRSAASAAIFWRIRLVTRDIVLIFRSQCIEMAFFFEFFGQRLSQGLIASNITAMINGFEMAQLTINFDSRHVAREIDLVCHDQAIGLAVIGRFLPRPARWDTVLDVIAAEKSAPNWGCLAHQSK